MASRLSRQYPGDPLEYDGGRPVVSDIARRPANFSLNGPRLAIPTGVVGGKQAPDWLYVTKLTPVPVQFPNTRPTFRCSGAKTGTANQHETECRVGRGIVRCDSHHRCVGRLVFLRQPANAGFWAGFWAGCWRFTANNGFRNDAAGRHGLRRGIHGRQPRG
jgi:hypothetical protein